jgi:FKBP-type peptidyl-prolyl cis-trans isomerase
MTPSPSSRPPVRREQITQWITVGGGIIAALMIALFVLIRPEAAAPTTEQVSSGAAASAGGTPDCDAFAGTPEVPGQLITTASGLGYQVIREGIAGGERPTATSRVTVHYEGRLENGGVFDSSYQRGQPATFGLNQVIAGWTEGLQLMQPCAKFRFTIPSALGYGDAGSPPTIPGGATLIFDVELLDVQ